MTNYLISAIARLVGNKVYLQDLRKILEHLPLEAGDEKTLQHLVADLNWIAVEFDKLKRDSHLFKWR